MSDDEAVDDDDLSCAHFQRDPLPEAGIRIILLTDLPEDSAARR